MFPNTESKTKPSRLGFVAVSICLIVGNETHGVSKEVLDICDGIVEIPMFGVNKSLNVMVSLGIVLYKVIENIQTWQTYYVLLKCNTYASTNFS